MMNEKLENVLGNDVEFLEGEAEYQLQVLKNIQKKHKRKIVFWFIGTSSEGEPEALIYHDRYQALFETEIEEGDAEYTFSINEIEGELKWTTETSKIKILL